MIDLLLSAFWFLLPAMVSNMMPVWAKYIRMLDPLNKPIDGGRQLAGKPLFGSNKTYRGFVAGVSFAICTGAAQYVLASNFESIRALELVDNPNLTRYILIAFLLGFGALLGDAIESLIKRQLEIKPGDTWFPYDQIDYVVGALVLASPITQLEGIEIIAIITVGFSLHPITTYLGHKLGIRDKPI